MHLSQLQLNWTFVDADDHHPQENIRKMASGNPLQDEACLLVFAAPFSDGFAHNIFHLFLMLLILIWSCGYNYITLGQISLADGSSQNHHQVSKKCPHHLRS